MQVSSLPRKTLSRQSNTDADAAGAADVRNKYIQQKQQQQFQQQLQQQLQQHQHFHLRFAAMHGSCMAGLILNQASCKAT